MFLLPKSKYSIKNLCRARDTRFGAHYRLEIFERIIVILSTKKFENFLQIVLSDRLSGKEHEEGARNL